MTLVLAVAAGVLIGLALGALGGGGSILAVPVLVYLLDQSATQATTGSLVVVGVTSLIGAAGHLRQTTWARLWSARQPGQGHRARRPVVSRAPAVGSPGQLDEQAARPLNRGTSGYQDRSIGNSEETPGSTVP